MTDVLRDVRYKGRNRNRIVARGAERVATSQPAGAQPATTQYSMPFDGFGRVVGARGQESARSAKIRRNAEFIGAKRHQGDADGHDVQGCGDNRLQGRSGWRRASHAWARPRHQTRARCCYDGKPLVSVVLLGFFERLRRAFSWPRCPDAPSPRWLARTNTVAVAAVNASAAFVDFLKLGAAADPFMRPEPRQMALFAADGQALTPFRASAFEHQPPVFRAHPHQKPVRLCRGGGYSVETCASLSCIPPDETNRQW